MTIKQIVRRLAADNRSNGILVKELTIRNKMINIEKQIDNYRALVYERSAVGWRLFYTVRGDTEKQVQEAAVEKVRNIVANNYSR